MRTAGAGVSAGCALLCLAVAIAPTHAQQPSAVAAPTVWQSPLNRDHALVGRIWDVGAARFVGAEGLYAGVRAATFVVLGENHDNPDHHVLQARVLAALVASGRAPAVAFEMLDTAQQPALDRYVRDHANDAAGLGPAVEIGRAHV